MSRRARPPLALLLAAAAALAFTAPAAAQGPLDFPLGHGVFFDFGELVATVEFRFEGGCNSEGQVSILRHFLGFDKFRTHTARLTCVEAGAGVAMLMEGVSEPTLRLVGGGVPGQLVALQGTYRDGVMAVYLR